jgi:hypothetical protein
MERGDVEAVKATLGCVEVKTAVVAPCNLPRSITRRVPMQWHDVAAALGQEAVYRLFVTFFELKPTHATLCAAVTSGNEALVKTVWDEVEDRDILELSKLAVTYRRVVLLRWLVAKLTMPRELRIVGEWAIWSTSASAMLALDGVVPFDECRGAAEWPELLAMLPRTAARVAAGIPRTSLLLRAWDFLERCGVQLDASRVMEEEIDWNAIAATPQTRRLMLFEGEDRVIAAFVAIGAAGNTAILASMYCDDHLVADAPTWTASGRASLDIGFVGGVVLHIRDERLRVEARAEIGFDFTGTEGFLTIEQAESWLV